jgi:hypothetical protein
MRSSSSGIPGLRLLSGSIAIVGMFLIASARTDPPARPLGFQGFLNRPTAPTRTGKRAARQGQPFFISAPYRLALETGLKAF